MRFLFAAAALAASTAFAAPAFAQNTTVASPPPATIEANAMLIQPGTIQRVNDLHFGTIVASPSMTGTVTVNANTGARTMNGGLTGLLADGQRGLFVGSALPDTEVTLTTSFPDFLRNEADLTKTVAFAGTIDSDGLSRLVGSTGVFYVGVGGTITIGLAQMPGRYTGDVTVTAEFR